MKFVLVNLFLSELDFTEVKFYTFTILYISKLLYHYIDILHTNVMFSK